MTVIAVRGFFVFFVIPVSLLIEMGKLSIGRVLDSFHISSGSRSSGGISMTTMRNELEKKPLMVEDQNAKLLTLKELDYYNYSPLQVKPKMVKLRVSMHCHGCARKVEKHISKMEGVKSYRVDLESKMVIVIGDVLPLEVLESVSKVKNAEFWDSPLKN